MSAIRLKWFVLILCITSSFHANEKLQVFFKEHCVKCHGVDKQKGKLRLDQFNFKVLSFEEVDVLNEALYQIEDGEMPPEDEPEISPEMLAQVKLNLSKTIEEASLKMQPEQVVLRRLNKVQYGNVIHDLFGIDPAIRDLTLKLPPDEKASGFDSVGKSLTISDIHMNAYLETANQIYAELNEHEAKAKTLDLFTKDYRITGSSHLVNVDGSLDILCSSFVNRRFKMANVLGPGFGKGTLTESGLYRIKVDAESLYTKDREAVERLYNDQIKWGENIELGDIPQLAFFLRRPSRAFSPRIETHLKSMDIMDGKRQVYEFEVWLPKGAYSLAFNYENGLKTEMENLSYRLINAEYPGSFLSRREVNELRQEKNVNTKEITAKKVQAQKDFFSKHKTPRIRVYGIELEGPIQTSQTQEQYVNAFGDQKKSLKENLFQVAQKIYRKPLQAEEVDPLIEKLKGIHDKKQAYRIGVKALLCSPKFLYIKEVQEDLNDWEIANRLSFFLWNSMPDEELFKLASNNELSNPKQLRTQVGRMLRDHKSKKFIDRFIFNWLGYKAFEESPPSVELFRNYHEFRIESVMKEETYRMFSHVLNHNLPVNELLTANYTFVNDRLSKHYGMPKIYGGAFQKVAIPAGQQRKGIMGHASVQVASANGVDTSPVLRGMWVMEHLLGTPPSLPPDDIEIPEPDTRGSLSLRDFYKRHRTDPNCNSCHVKIDPLGFALENFNAIGMWRDEYENKEKIDASGYMPNGKKFKTAREMVDVLSDDQSELFVRNTLEKLLICASGREVNVLDKREVERLMSDLESNDYRLKDMICAVVTSSIFLKK